jgi:hypothetical protein
MLGGVRWVEYDLAIAENIRFQPALNFSQFSEPETAADFRRMTESAGPLASIYYVEGAEDRRMPSLAEKLRKCQGVATSYVKPPAEPATLPAADATSIGTGTARATSSGVAPPITPDLSPLQDFLLPAPAGIDLREARLHSGGDGSGMWIADIEGAWRFSHEAVVPGAIGMLPNGVMSKASEWRDHGTAVLGLLCGNGGNQRGIVGIAPSSRLAGSSMFRDPSGSPHSATAILEAGRNLRKGDVLLLELHRPGPRFGFTAPQDQRGFIPLEWWQDDQAYINAVLALDVIVVATAGNGAEPLDDPLYDNGALLQFPPQWRNPFRRSPTELGSILVGAGAPPPGTNGLDHGPDRSRLPFSNWGEAVDSQGWGREVVTSGYGDLQSGPDEDRWYTRRFCGTSSAAPMVAGVIACVQGILRARGPRILSQLEARQLLRIHGSPQQAAPGRPSNQRIGPRPDLARLIPAAMTIASQPAIA